MSEGKTMRDLRRRAGLTQAQVANMLGTHVMTVSKWEREGSEHRGSAAARGFMHALAYLAKVGHLESFQSYMEAQGRK